MIYCVFQYWIDFIFFVWCCKYYVQEVVGVGEVVVWINKWLVDRIFVIYGCYGWYFGQQMVGGNFVVMWVIYVEGIMIECCQCVGDFVYYCYWVGIVMECVEQMGDLFMNYGVVGDGSFEFVIFGLGWFFVVQQDIIDFKIIRFGC